MSWLPYSLTATVLLGISMSLYKMPSFKGYSSGISSIWTNAVSAIFAWVILAVAGQLHVSDFTTVSWYALLWGGMFGITMILQKKILHHVETNSVFPITSSISGAFTVCIGILFLSERVSLIQAIGIGTILLAVFLYTRKDGSFPLNVTTISLAIAIVLLGTLSKFTQKIGVEHDSISHFMAWQFVGAALSALGAMVVFGGSKMKDILDVKKYWKGAVLISIFSALGGYAILYALSIGPLSGVYAIHPAYTCVAGIFGWLFFQEKLTKRKVCLSLLTVVGVILLKIG